MKIHNWAALAILTAATGACLLPETTCADAGGTDNGDGACDFPEPDGGGASSSSGTRATTGRADTHTAAGSTGARSDRQTPTP